MKFEDAKNQIRELFPNANLISFKFEIDNWKADGALSDRFKCVAIVCHGRENPTMPPSSYFDAETWQGVITKAEMSLVPGGTGSMEEAPEEETKEV